MQQFVVPQFIEVEDKIFGPVTTRQFVILLVSAGLVFISYKLADFMLFIFLLAFFGGTGLIVAFVKINGQTFHYFLLNIIQSMLRPSRRIWNKKYGKKQLEELRRGEAVEVVEKIKARPQVSYSRLRDLSLIVNTGGHYHGE